MRQSGAVELGKQKVPTLRNVDLRPTKHFIKAYAHNGYFKSLEEIVHFYNTRDVPGAGWPPPEVAANINTTEMGNLGLNHGEELAIVAFLKHPLRWLHAQEVAGKLQSLAMPFPKTLRAAAQGRPNRLPYEPAYIDIRWAKTKDDLSTGDQVRYTLTRSLEDVFGSGDGDRK